MKQYKTKDFVLISTKFDLREWVSTDKQYTITTSSHEEARYFVYKWIGDWEWVGIQELSLDNAVKELNNMIESGEIEKYT